MESGTALALDWRTVPLVPWMQRNSYHLDAAFAVHRLRGLRKLKRVRELLNWATEVEDGTKNCPDCLRSLMERVGEEWKHYWSMFHDAPFWRASDFVSGLIRRWMELYGSTRRAAQPYMNQPIRRFLFRGCRHHWGHRTFCPI